MTIEPQTKARRGRPQPPIGFALPHLRSWLEHKGVTQVRIAEAVRRSEGVVSRWLNGQVNVNAQQLAIIASVLGVSPEALFRSPAEEALTADAREIVALLSNMDSEERRAAMVTLRSMAKRQKA